MHKYSSIVSDKEGHQLSTIIKQRPTLNEWRPFDGISLSTLPEDRWATLEMKSTGNWIPILSNPMAGGARFDKDNQQDILNVLHGKKPFQVMPLADSTEWGVIASQMIPKGSVVGIHFGEVRPIAHGTLIQLKEGAKEIWIPKLKGHEYLDGYKKINGILLKLKQKKKYLENKG